MHFIFVKNIDFKFKLIKRGPRIDWDGALTDKLVDT